MYLKNNLKSYLNKTGLLRYWVRILYYVRKGL